MEMDTARKGSIELYSKAEEVVKSFVECLIKNDLHVIVASWLHFRLEKKVTPVSRLKELFFILFRSEMVLEITHDFIILFKDSAENMHIPLVGLSDESVKYIKGMTSLEFIWSNVTCADLFFQDIYTITIHLKVYRKFRFNSVLKESELWKKIVVTFMDLVLEDNVNCKYFDGRGEEVLLCFVVDEISYSYKDYCANAKGDGSEWRKKNEKYISNLSLLYKELSSNIATANSDVGKWQLVVKDQR